MLVEERVRDARGRIVLRQKHQTLAQLMDAGLITPEQRANLLVVVGIRNPFDLVLTEYARNREAGSISAPQRLLEQLEPTHFGRVGAQVAGQVVRQRLREAERETLFDEFAHREGKIITGSVSRVEPAGIILDLGKAEAILRTTDQSASEHYRIGQHVKAYVLEVRRTTRGPLIYVSRTHKAFLRRLFELEVPEVRARHRRDPGHRP